MCHQKNFAQQRFSQTIQIVFESSKCLRSRFEDSDSDSEAQIDFWIGHELKSESNLKSPYLTTPIYSFALLCHAHVDFESEIKSLPWKHNFSSVSLWIALKLETPTYLKISEVPPCPFFHKMLSKKLGLRDLWTQFCDNGSLLTIEMWACYICTIYLGPQLLPLIIFTPQDAGDIKELFRPPHPREQGCLSSESFQIKFMSKSPIDDAII